MICVSIGRGRHRHVIAEHAHLVERGAQLVELRLDYIRGRVNIHRLLNNRPGPVVVTCRRSKDGGKYKGSEEERRILLRTAIASGAEYVDLEEDVANNIPRYGKTKRIISYHNFQETPDDLEEIHARLTKCGADIVKMATFANHVRDNLRLLRVVKNAKVPTIGFCMGEIGIPSRLLCGKFGSPFTYATYSAERQLAPGQLTFDEMQHVYRYEQITPQTEVYGVIGDPIAHSLSPHIHNEAFHAHHLDKVYLPFRIPPEDLADFMDDVSFYGIKGLSVTIPHKEAVLPMLTRLNGAVRAVRAANTIKFDGTDITGHNTDYRAAMDALEDLMGLGPTGGSPLQGKNIVVLGAGGAARAIAAGCKRRLANVTITSRTFERADKLAQELSCKAVEWPVRLVVPCDVLINCTPVGMHPKVDECPYDRNRISSSMIVFDTVYNPENTLLIKHAQKRGCLFVTGVEMFVRQAALQYELFTGNPAPMDVMRAALKRATNPVRVHGTFDPEQAPAAQTADAQDAPEADEE